MTNSLQRHAADYKDFDVINRPIDFDKVNIIFEGQRRNTRDFLKTVFEAYQNKK